jgi:hypothetical protein
LFLRKPIHRYFTDGLSRSGFDKPGEGGKGIRFGRLVHGASIRDGNFLRDPFG